MLTYLLWFLSFSSTISLCCVSIYSEVENSILHEKLLKQEVNNSRQLQEVPEMNEIH